MGRPTKLDEKMLKKSDAYLKNFDKFGDIIPSIVGLAIRLDVRRETLYNWAAAGQEDDAEEIFVKFFNIFKKINESQLRTLLNGGLRGDMNPAITKLVLGKHGYHEKNLHEHMGEGGGPVQTKTYQVTGVEPKGDQDAAEETEK